MPEIIVVGGGPSGMMAAGQAAQAGGSVVLLEKTRSTGRKLRLTGAGRCNLTNTLPVTEFIEHVHGNGRFIRQALTSFSHETLVEFFKELNLPTITEPTGRIYPASGRAVDVLNAMTHWLSKLGVVVKSDRAVQELIVENDAIVGVKTSHGIEQADAVVVATGGASYPETGSSGDGYRLAESVGHTIVPVRPSLVPLEVAGDIPGRLKGLSLPEVRVSIIEADKRTIATSGELLFTHYGISGPVILRISRNVVDALAADKPVILSLDMVPDLDSTALDARLRDLIKTHGKRQFHNIVGEIVPDRMAVVLMERCGVAQDVMGSQMTGESRGKLVRLLKDFRLEVYRARPIAEAIVTAGGVETGEIDPRTMASRVVKGLYFAGEVIDVDGDSGGFNLQIAFATGWLAGRSAGKSA